MNKEEIEELKDFTIDLNDIDELALGLEVCSKKSNMVIQKFADTIIQLQQENKHLKDLQKNMDKLYAELEQENQKYKEVFDKSIELLGNYKHYSTPDEKQNGDNEDLVNNAFDILKEVE